ncbi:MAG: hypothetical protein NTY63_02565 [Candidatus Bipolaricaulota bacterium]|nr:hypothetical protein [Candidatus Bipolaricaulota bacterium]
MPLRRNECQACGNRFRTLEAAASADATACPACGSPKTRRLPPHVAVHFKGSGYYKTDHGRRGNGSREGHDKEQEPMAASSKTATDD